MTKDLDTLRRELHLAAAYFVGLVDEVLDDGSSHFNRYFIAPPRGPSICPPFAELRRAVNDLAAVELPWEGYKSNHRPETERVLQAK